MVHFRPFLAPGLIALAVLASLAPSAGAQQVYRIVGPDGRVTFSDKPPLDSNVKLAPVATAANTSGSSTSGLPLELRQAADKYPVTIYTSNNCAPCVAGRAYLASRGIPYTEKTISSTADAEALKRLASVNSLPLLTVGGQQLKGYSEGEWGQFLDAAGYPARSALPASWRNPEPAPLVAVQRQPSSPVNVGEDDGSTATARRPGTTPRPANDNPAGIKF